MNLFFNLEKVIEMKEIFSDKINGHSRSEKLYFTWLCEI